jgi:uncharacterized protein YjbJ (UPF0337 family)
MGITDKLTGRVKKAAGDLTDDASLRREGRKEGRGEGRALQRAGARRREGRRGGRSGTEDLSNVAEGTRLGGGGNQVGTLRASAWQAKPISRA